MLRKVTTFFMVFVASLFFTGSTYTSTSPTGKITFETSSIIPIVPELPATLNPVNIQEKITTDQVTCLAKNIYFEAATQSTAGKLAVAFVTKNRVDSHHFPNSYCEVIYEGVHYSSGLPKKDRCQFSWYCDGRGDNPYDGKSWKNTQVIAQWFYDHKYRLIDITDGATHYHADWMKKYPKWAKQYKQNVRIDDHIFYQSAEHSHSKKTKIREMTLANL
jgi:spore germination cell wall hydrolase CwlJ-like protein